MVKTKSRNKARKNRHMRIRQRLTGTPVKPRISVFRSNKHIYAQIIDDVTVGLRKLVDRVTDQSGGDDLLRRHASTRFARVGPTLVEEVRGQSLLVMNIHDTLRQHTAHERGCGHYVALRGVIICVDRY